MYLRIRQLIWFLLVVSVLATLSFIGVPAVGLQRVESAVATAGPFMRLSTIESHLKRGKSTKQDVQRLVGPPDGFGLTVLPPNHIMREIWLYSDVASTGAVPEETFVRVNMRHQMLLIFFNNDLFDGFLWTSSEQPPDRSGFLSVPRAQVP